MGGFVPMTDELLEQLGMLIDKADNYLALQENHFLPPHARLDAAVQGLVELRDTLLEMYQEGDGEDWWPMGHPMEGKTDGR